MREVISCDPILFKNGAKLYWSYDCDSSWLTFENSGIKEEIFSLGDGMQYLTGRLGFVSFQEYEKTFLAMSKVISGCCSPPEYYLLDKITGQTKEELGRLIFYSEIEEFPILVSLKHSSYDTLEMEDYNSLRVYNVNTDKAYFIPLPENEIDKALEKVGENYPEYLFQEPIVRADTLILSYYLRKPRRDRDNRPVKTIFIDLKKYSS